MTVLGAISIAPELYTLTFSEVKLVVEVSTDLSEKPEVCTTKETLTQ